MGENPRQQSAANNSLVSLAKTEILNQQLLKISMCLQYVEADKILIRQVVPVGVKV